MVKARPMIIAGGILAIVGGVLILQSGVGTRSFLLTVISISEQKFGGSLPGVAESLINLVIIALGSLISLGGLLAILGGVLVLLKHRVPGKIFIALGGGMGLVGIAISLAYDIFMEGPSAIVLHVPYWVGVLIASIGRSLS